MVELLYLGAFLIALFIGLLITPAVRAAALARDFVDKPGERKIHSAAVAYGGGIAVAIAAALATGAGWFVKSNYFQLLQSRQDLLRGATLACIAAGALGALVLGLIDDRHKLSAHTKLAAQFVLAIVAVAGGVRVTAFVGDTIVMQALTVLWIVVITNSFNLLDNMDGLCAGVAAISAALLGLLAMDGAQWNLMIALGAVAGACVGFLKYNRPPARIFLGDAGSLLLGFVMACFTVMVTYYNSAAGRTGGHLAVGIPLLILAIPLYDTLSVIAIRLKEGRPIMRGDTSHFSHRLVDLGMTRGQAVVTIHLACLAIGLPAIVLGQLSEERGMLIIGQAFLVLTIIALLERAGRQRAARKDAQPPAAPAEKSPEASPTPAHAEQQDQR